LCALEEISIVLGDVLNNFSEQSIKAIDSTPDSGFIESSVIPPATKASTPAGEKAIWKMD